MKFLCFVTFLVVSSSHAYHLNIPKYTNNKTIVANARLAAAGYTYSLTPASDRTFTSQTSPWVYNTFRINQNGTILAKFCSNKNHLFFVNARTNRINTDVRTHISYPLLLSFTCCNSKCNKVKAPKIGDVMRETSVKVRIGSQLNQHHLCFYKSEVIFNVLSTIPKFVLQECHVNFHVFRNALYAVQKSSGDLVVKDNHCFYGSWSVNIPYELDCPGSRMPVINSLAIKFYLNDDADFHLPMYQNRAKRQVSGFGNSNAPVFSKPHYTVSVPEEQEKGYVVTTIQATDPENTLVEYSMLAVLDARSQHMFEINEKSGVITTSVKLDREFMDMHYFRVVASDDGIPRKSSTATLQIRVEDMNDHTPMFEQDYYRASVKESVTVGTVVATVRATDKDSGDNANILYSILNSDDADDMFAIEKDNGIITTKFKLDREKNELYTLTIQAVDQAQNLANQKTATATVGITVLDVNDNYPQFSDRTYSVHVREDINWVKNPIIAEIKATDADSGVNSAIRYTLIGGNTRGHFSMDGVNGDISVVAPLDYEAFRSYRLVVRAQDGGSPPRSNTTQILVNVVDMNDNDPRFYTSLFQESVMENVDKDHGIVQVQAFDSDGGQNGQIKYMIKDGQENMPITIDTSTGWISTSRKLDREEGSSYKFVVVALDQGRPPRSATASVMITVQDVNDNDPKFNPKMYQAKISEDSPPGSRVVSVSASDPDENARIFYQITNGNERGKFNVINQNKKGLISLAQPLDYRQSKHYTITVTATDSGGRYDTAIVYINVTDANNFRPSFVQTPYSASIPEDAAEGSLVLVVEATDRDVGENARITYTIDNEFADIFRIHASTGAITTAGKLDREKLPGYTISVTAQDHGNPPMSDTTDVEIVVTDVNDNAPIFNKLRYSSSIMENLDAGTSVAHLQAKDSDQGLNGRIRYTFEGGNDGNGAFTIAATSGVIRNKRILDRETKAEYDLVAYAVDLGQPPLSTSVHVKVKVEDQNDNPPRFESDKIRLYIAENSPIGSTVGEIRAHDPDEGPNAAIQYSIIDGSGANAFKLTTNHQGAAEITSLRDFDYESRDKKFTFTLRAESPPKQSDVSVEIWVTDVNDHAPTLKHFSIYFNNYKNFFPDGPIGIVPAHDNDVADKLKYRFSSGNNANFLLLNETTGEITLSPGLNTNVASNVEMEVSVSDGLNEVVKTCKLIVRYASKDVLIHSVTVRLNDMTEKAFLSHLYDYFILGLRAVFPVPKEYIHVFNIQDDTDVDAQILNVSFTIRDPSMYETVSYFDPQYIKEKLYLNRQVFADWAKVQVLPFDDNLCVREPCRNSQVCQSVLKFGTAAGFIHSNTMFFRPIYPVNTFICKCPDGFTGMDKSYLCDIEVNLCYSNPCGINGTCLRKEGGYTCICHAGYTGKNCEISLSDSKCEPGICHGGSMCHATANDGIHCENCTLQTDYKNDFCQLTARQFKHNTFLTFPSLKQRQRINLQLTFATRERNGLLLYNGRYNDQHDFIALEIIDSIVVFSFSLGVNISTVSASLEGGVSDGQWHKVSISYVDKVAIISLDDCDSAISIKYGSRLGNYNCANKTVLNIQADCILCYQHLDLTGPLQIGGLPHLPEHNFQVSQDNFVGCIKDVYVDHSLLDLNNPVQDNGTEIGCRKKDDFCRLNPCLNGGSCVNGWGSFMCHCPDGYVGKNCNQSVQEARHFHGNGFLSFNPSLRPVNLPWNVSLAFRTRQSNGLLLAMIIGSDNYAVFKLVDGNMHYIYNKQNIIMDSVSVSDGKWHNIEVSWTTTGIFVSLDHDQYVVHKKLVATIQGQYVNMVSIGGLDKTENQLEFTYFKGCIQDVRIGGMKNAWLHAKTEQNVTHGCSLLDPCESNPCPHNSWCLDTWDDYICQCEPGYIGEKCVGVCELNPCENDAKCRTYQNGYHHNYYPEKRYDQWSQNSYWCDCDQLYTGRYCQVSVGQQPCPKNWWGYPVCGPCECDVENGYNPDCNKTTGQCYSKDNYYQTVNAEQQVVSAECNCHLPGSTSSQCHGADGQCSCKKGVHGRKCNLCSNPFAEITENGCQVVYDRCPETFSNGIWWKGVQFGTLSIQECPEGSEGMATRSCEKQSLWSEPDMFNCTSDTLTSFQGPLRQLESGQIRINKFLSISYSHSLFGAINDTLLAQRSLYGNDVHIIARMLYFFLDYEQSQKGLNLTHTQDRDYVPMIVKMMSDIIGLEYEHVWEEIQERHGYGVEDLLDTFEKYGATLVNTRDDTFTSAFQVTTDNFVFGLDTVSEDELWSYDEQTSEMKVSPYLSDSGEHVQLPKFNNIPGGASQIGAQVVIPLKILGINQPTGKLMDKNKAVISYAIYQNLGYLLPNQFSDDVRRRYGIKTAVSTPVMTLTMKATNDNKTLHGQQLEEDVQLIFDVESPNTRIAPQCVFWEVDKMQWSSLGCQAVRGSNGKVVCSCNHMTSFAVVMDITDIKYFKEETFAQYIVSYVGLILSHLLLILTLIVLASLRGLQTNSNTIHKNLVATILIVNIIFLVALKLRTDLSTMEFPCKVIAIMLHYFNMCIFAWMCVEGIHLYRMMTELRDINHGQMRFYYCLGYGVPAIIVGLSVGVRADEYGNYFFCWLSIYESAIWSLVGPICFFIIMTLGAFAMAVSASIQIKDTVTDYGNLRTLLWLGIGLLPILGASWAVMLLSVNEIDTLFSYFVPAFALVEAVYVFLGYCILNKKVRLQLKYAWLQLKGEKVPYDASLSGTRTTLASRSALAYNSPFDVVMHRNVGISTSSTTSRSTAKTSSDPYRSDFGESALRVTDSSASNYGNLTTDLMRRGSRKSHGKKGLYIGQDGEISSRSGRRRRRRGHSGETESDSDMSVDRASLDLASSHSSDDEEYDNDVNWKKQNNRNNVPDVISQSPHKPNNMDNSDYQSISPPYAVPGVQSMNFPVTSPSILTTRTSPLPLNPPVYTSKPQWSVPTQMPVSMSAALQRQQKLGGINPLVGTGFNWLRDTSGNTHNERPTSLNITEGLEDYAPQINGPGGEVRCSPPMADGNDAMTPGEREDSVPPLPPPPTSMSDDFNYPDNSSHNSSPSLRLASSITQPMSIPPLTTAEISDGSEESNETSV